MCSDWAMLTLRQDTPSLGKEIHLDLEERPGRRQKWRGGVISMWMVIQGVGVHKVTWGECMGQRSTACRAQPGGRDRRAEKLPDERGRKKMRTGWRHGT